MKKILFIVFILFCSQIHAQKQTAFWYFGELAGIDFNSGSPVAITDGQMVTTEGCASISDYSGNLLLYTNGQTVWNKNHEIMPNGTNLNGHFSSTNSAIIIPKPHDVNRYYIFTVDDLAGVNGLQYSEIDMLQNGGLGDVTSNKNISLQTPTTEKISAVKHRNDTDWWVLSHRWDSDEFVAYLVTASGISSSVTSSIGINITGDTDNSVGSMKLSPNGNKLAIVHSYGNNKVQLFSFNDLTGVLTNPITLSGYTGATGAYGVEFSPDSKTLYVSDTGGSIYQYNTELTTQTDISSSRIIIGSSIDGLGALQLAPDGKIYAARENSNHLGAITNPNTLGTGSAYVNDALYLEGRRSKLGLPPFIQSFFWKAVTVESACFGDDTYFTLINPEMSQNWNFDDPSSGTNNTSTLANPTHTFTSSGTYSVKVEVTNFLGEVSITIVNVIISETPLANQPIDYVLCDNNDDLDYTNGVIQTFLLSTKDSEVLETQDPTLFEIFYYEDSDFTQEINKTIDYENISSNNQTIYVKVFNKNDDTCFDFTAFDLIVNKIPEFDLLEEKIICSNYLPDSVEVENPLDVYDYSWTLDDGTVFSTDETILFNDVSLIPNTGLSLTLTTTDATNTCTNSKSILIRKIIPAVFTQDDIIIIDLSDNNTVTINPLDPNFNASDYEFALGNSSGMIGPYQSELIFENVSPGIKIIYIRDIYGCSTANLEISIIGFPKYFTPNNDGTNDTWHVLGVNQTFYSASIIKIFDRFGKIITTVSPSSEGWDGFYNGEELPETDYWFTVQLIDSSGETREHNGHFSLIRR
ncbi:MAG: gliding motility-associated-like protein [Flavobacteriales bacterium]|jgi:gliding motility-associated-like protein